MTLYKNKKGELSTNGKLGMIVFLAITLIVGAVFAGIIGDEQSTLTDLQSAENQTVTFPSVNDSITLNGQALSGSITAVNASNASLTVPSSNFTTSDLVQTNGEYRLTLTNLDSDWTDEEVNLTYDYEPVGYNQDSGSRSTATLPLLFFALALLAIAVTGIRDWLGK